MIRLQPEWKIKLWNDVHQQMQESLNSWQTDVGVRFQPSAVPPSKTEETIAKIETWLKNHGLKVSNQNENLKQLSTLMKMAAHEIIRKGIRSVQEARAIEFSEGDFVNVTDEFNEDDFVTITTDISKQQEIHVEFGKTVASPEDQLLSEWNEKPSLFWAQRPYPGKAGIFFAEYPQDLWKSLDDSENLRCLRLISSVEDSFLQIIHATVKKNGVLQLAVVARGEVESVQKYFKSIGLTFDREIMWAEATEPEKIQGLARLILQFNEINEPWHSLISEFAQNGTWSEKKNLEEEARVHF